MSPPICCDSASSAFRCASLTAATGTMGHHAHKAALDLTSAVGGNSNRRPIVILALGAIESARLAKLVPGVGSTPNASLIKN